MTYTFFAGFVLVQFFMLGVGALGCRGFARVDLFLTPEGKIVFNEVNTIPGFTSHSRYPTMMKGIGLDFSALVDRIITLGVTG